MIRSTLAAGFLLVCGSVLSPAALAASQITAAAPAMEMARDAATLVTSAANNPTGDPVPCGPRTGLYVNYGDLDARLGTGVFPGGKL